MTTTPDSDPAALATAGGALADPRPFGRPTRLLFLVTEDWYFRSHRLPIARGARESGYTVAAAMRVSRHGETIRAVGADLHPVAIHRGGRNPFREFLTLLRLVRLYRRVRPDLVHHAAIKPVLYGSIAAWLTGVPRVVNALTGLGYFFIEGNRHGLLRRLVRGLLRMLLNRAGSHTVMQNPDDLDTLRRDGLLRGNAYTLIRGSGVDTAAFPTLPERAAPDGRPVAAFVARMLWDKGLGELAEAARLLKARGTGPHIVLVGPLDPDNPACVSEAALRGWEAEGLLRWRGGTDDILEVWREAAIAVLPSYREGLPKALLEAASCGRPLIAADVPGCREICRQDETGLLVPVRTAKPLADALERLAGDKALRARLGAGARQLVETELSVDIVVAQHLELYRALLTR